MADTFARATVLGDGGWGTAMSLVLHERGTAVTVWGHDADYLEQLGQTRRNPRFLPGVPLPEELVFEADMAAALAGAEAVIVAVPTRFLAGVLAQARGDMPEGAAVISLTKGIAHETLQRPTEIIAETLGTDRVCALSGPSHAEEVARRLPATVTVAARDSALAERAQGALMTSMFRIYTSTDVVGVELGGALKNVIGLAAGIVIGMELGDNAMAALLTRGLAEMTRLGVALGADPLTFAGLSGMGDLVTTCISPHGRNRSVGVRLGRGETLASILDGMQMVAEGVDTARSALALAERAGVDLPITREVCRILHEDKDPRRAMRDLMARDARPEWESQKE